MGQAGKTARTVARNRTARTGLSGKGCQLQTERIRQLGQNRTEKTATKGQACKAGESILDLSTLKLTV
jgi:hypothetical protein